MSVIALLHTEYYTVYQHFIYLYDISHTSLACPQAPPENWEKGLVTLAKISVCAVSAVFVWSRQIMSVYH